MDSVNKLHRRRNIAYKTICLARINSKEYNKALKEFAELDKEWKDRAMLLTYSFYKPLN